ncbi:hypothetical protein DTO027B5_2669 [Paecilomyces variotii]|nr:hypothetical protein DTO027B3_2676 [Paecilomyces variotii]KAJ9335527.1 hypothetical protein DTO027B5_2669 [Paecilomyces variotii]KAJ9376889.1 hypothetical protein DTO063F5_8573 [Paecilomyces variotii]
MVISAQSHLDCKYYPYKTLEEAHPTIHCLLSLSCLGENRISATVEVYINWPFFRTLALAKRCNNPKTDTVPY